jgi:hypothetical protein
MRFAYCALQSYSPTVLHAADACDVKQTQNAGPVSSLVGAAFGRFASGRPRAISLIGRTRGSTVGGILEAETAKSSRRARHAFLATRIKTLPAPSFYGAPRIINIGANLPGRSEQCRKCQSGNYQLSHVGSSPLSALYAIGAYVGYLTSISAHSFVSFRASGRVPRRTMNSLRGRKKFPAASRKTPCPQR